MTLHKYLLVVLLVLAMCAVLLPLGGCGSGSNDDGPSPFAGNYAGTYTGNGSGSWTATVDLKGDVTLTVDPGEPSEFAGTGHINRTGAANLSGTGGGVGNQFLMTWTGAFVQTGNAIHGSGNWTTDNGGAGTWEGDRT